ncbi:MAG: hypothetical protein H6734_11555 [Alphaproteobacteria bacterium]|nr:hypothetical protein [Alphaproteobacteria bacterium]
MKRAWMLVLGAAGLSLGVACGPNCQNTCEQVYTQCNIQKAGRSQDELLRTCLDQCEGALKKSGDLGDYQPEQRRTSNAPITLENDAQAAAWMDCVWNHAPDASAEQCDEIDPSNGYCAPI